MSADYQMSESQIRDAETSLMIGRLTGLSVQRNLLTRERVGICLATEVLEDRVREIRGRMKLPVGETRPTEPKPEPDVQALLASLAMLTAGWRAAAPNAMMTHAFAVNSLTNVIDAWRAPNGHDTADKDRQQ